jgi:hypothetical protein
MASKECSDIESHDEAKALTFGDKLPREGLLLNSTGA